MDMYLPQCVHLCIASYISSPADLYHYTRYLYNARRCTTPQQDGFCGSVLHLRSDATNPRRQYCDNRNAWRWIRSLRPELGNRTKQAICRRLEFMGLGFLPQALIEWNDLDGNENPESPAGANVYLAGSVPLCAVTEMSLEQVSDADLYVRSKSFKKVKAVLQKEGFILQYKSTGAHYTNLLKWWVYRYIRPSGNSDNNRDRQARIDVIKLDKTSLDVNERIRDHQLASSFDMSGCAVAFDGKTTVVPAPEQTFARRLKLRQPFPYIFRKLLVMPHRYDPIRCEELISLCLPPPLLERRTNNQPKRPFRNEENRAIYVTLALLHVRKVLERIFKYEQRGFTISKCHAYHALVLLDISTRIIEFRRSNIFRRHACTIQRTAFTRQIREDSRFLRSTAIDLVAIMRLDGHQRRAHEFNLLHDGSTGSEATTANRLHRFYVLIRSLSRLRRYLESIEKADLLPPRLVRWHRLEFIQSLDHLPPSVKKEMKGQIDWRWTSSDLNASDWPPNQQHQNRHLKRMLAELGPIMGDERGNVSDHTRSKRQRNN